MISIHALREEGDIGDEYYQKHKDISIHALREEGDAQIPRFYEKMMISIHALREEGDRSTEGRSSTERNFNPRPPRGGRLTAKRPLPGQLLFQSTPSARRATYWVFESRIDPKFQSTPSARRATTYWLYLKYQV